MEHSRLVVVLHDIQYTQIWHVSLKYPFICYICNCTQRDQVISQEAEVAQGVPGRLRPRIFLTFGTTRVVDRQPYASAAFTPVVISHFQRLSPREPRKKSQMTPPGIDSGTVRLVAQCLDHYVTPGPRIQRDQVIIHKNYLLAAHTSRPTNVKFWSLIMFRLHNECKVKVVLCCIKHQAIKAYREWQYTSTHS